MRRLLFLVLFFKTFIEPSYVKRAGKFVCTSTMNLAWVLSGKALLDTTVKCYYNYSLMPAIFIKKHLSARSYLGALKEKAFGKTPFEVIFNKKLQLVLDEVVAVTKAIYKKQLNASYNNILLYGKGGTGKTMFARYLAHITGMEYAETTGAMLQSISSINLLFAYADMTGGLIVLIDEADLLFADRKSMLIGSDSTALSYLLYRLSEGNNKLMLIWATNHPLVINEKLAFDESLGRHFTHIIEMSLPDEESRYELFAMYIKRLAATMHSYKDDFENGLKINTLLNFARLTDHMSGADIAMIVRQAGNKFALAALNGKSAHFITMVTQVIMEYRSKMSLSS